MNLDKKMKQALESQQKGDLGAAELSFRQILKTQTSHFISVYSLGVIAAQRGDLAKAFQFFDRAAGINPGYAPTWFNRGLVLQGLGKDRDALESFGKACALDPSYQEARTKREVLAKDMQRRLEGYEGEGLAQMATRALELQQQGKLDESEGIFKEILEQKPWDFVSLYSLGVIAQQRGDHEQALHFFDVTAQGNPQYAPNWYNRGTVLFSMKRNEEALSSFDKALELDPTYPEAYVNRGAVLQEMNRHVEALENYNRLLSHHPDNDKALGNKGILLTEFKRHDEATEVFRELLRINPDYDYALGLQSFAQMHSCNWEGLDLLTSAITKGLAQGKRVCKTMALLAISDNSAEHLQCARIFGEYQFPAQAPIWRGEIYPHKKIRIGYVSPDFREHPVGHLTAGIFENHDRSRFETFAFSLGIDDHSRLRSRISSAFDQFIDVRERHSRDIANLIRSMEIDILVDLAGYTADSRTAIFAHHPAPVQANYLGYPSTLGVTYLDYIIADRHIIPEDDQKNFTEKVAYLPHTYLPTDRNLQVAERTPSREEFGLPAKGFVFCSFNHAYKINPAIFDRWMRIMEKTPESVLWLMKLTEPAEANLRKEAKARGIDPERLIFATRVPKVEDHLARYRLADLFLDTTPYNAHTTASDALFVGLPVLAYRGNAFPGRVAAGLLHAIGLPELVTESLDQYEELAVRLAREPEVLSELKERLGRNRLTHPLFDTVGFCRNLEAVFEGMWERYQRGEAPESFGI